MQRSARWRRQEGMDGPATSNGIGREGGEGSPLKKRGQRVGKLHVPGPSTGWRLLRLIEHRAPLALVADARERSSSCLLPFAIEQRTKSGLGASTRWNPLLSWRRPRSPGNTCQGRWSSEPAHEGGKFVTDTTKMLRHALGLW